MSESVSTDAPTSSSSLDDAQAALDDGDWATARKLLQSIDPETLGDEQRARFFTLSHTIRPDRAAVALTAIIGVGLLAIIAALFT